LFNRKIQARPLQNPPRKISRNTKKIVARSPFIRLISLRASNQQHKNFLRYFLRCRGIAAHVQRKPINSPLVPRIERGERRLISFAKLPEQLLIFDWRFCHGSAGCCPRSCYPLLELDKSFHLFFAVKKAARRASSHETDTLLIGYRTKA